MCALRSHVFMFASFLCALGVFSACTVNEINYYFRDAGTVSIRLGMCHLLREGGKWNIFVAKVVLEGY